MNSEKKMVKRMGKIKEFFRLTKGKGILFALSLLLIILLYYETYLLQTKSFMPIICKEGTKLFNFFGVRYTCVNNIEFFLIIIFTIFVPLFFSFFLSCGIISSFNKMKRGEGEC